MSYLGWQCGQKQCGNKEIGNTNHNHKGGAKNHEHNSIGEIDQAGVFETGGA